MKTCSKCGEEKPLDDYYPTRGECKACVKTQVREWRRANPDKHRAQNQRWRDRYPDKALEGGRRRNARRTRDGEKLYLNSIKRIYGLEPENYYAMVDDQDGRCASCGDPDPGGKRRHLNVDHCHTTLKIRGLLCLSCNVALGKLRDDEDRILSLLVYLQNSKEVMPT